MRTWTKSLVVYAIFALLGLAFVSPASISPRANAQAGQYTFTAVSSGRGAVQVSPQKAFYSYGETVTLAAAPDPGWDFMGWQGAVEGWGDVQRNYRIPLAVNANGFGRVDKPIEVEINFTTLFASVGQSNTFDPDTLRVVEVSSAGQIIDDNVTFQFDRASNYNATTRATGVLVFLMKGSTSANASRHYHVYFDIAGSGITPPSFVNLVTRSNVTDQGQASYRFRTSNATYDYHRFGGGFSSIVDNDGNDWVDYRPTPVSGAGAYRGLPNMRPPPDGYFHPGNEIGTTSLVSNGPLKHTIRTVTNDGLWEVRWEFFPTYARMTVVKRDPSKNYWVLYEGMPGGSLDVNSDTYTRSNGTTATIANSFGGDLPNPEWIYFSDPPLGRSFFLVHHEDDALVDSFRLDNADPSKANMVIFGFGRGSSGNTTYLSATPKVFTIGFMDEIAFAPASATIDAAYRDLSISLGSVQAQSLGSQAGASPVNFTITGNTVMTATFEPPAYYTLTTAVIGNGVFTFTPNPPLFAPGDEVVLTATANPGSLFTGWSGDASGEEPSITVTMDANKTITANFIDIPYAVATAVVGGGAIVTEPDQPTYHYGDVVTVTATSPANWRFTGWSGDVSGTANPQVLTIDGDKSLTANFVELHTLAVNKAGQGSVGLSPDESVHVHGTSVILTATAETGWLFTGWSGDLSGDANPATLIMESAKSVTATFTPLYPLTVTVVGDGGAVERSPSATQYLAGAPVTLTAIPTPGWRFEGWSGDAQGSALSVTLTMNAPKTVTATFVEEEYTLTLTTQGQGAITADPVKPFYRYGDEVTLTATATAGWFFMNWSGDAAGGADETTILMDGNKAATAHFSDVAYTLAVNTTGGGEVLVTDDLPYYAPGTQVTVEAKPEAGWLFTGWSGDLTGNTNPAMLTMDGNKTITANFTSESNRTLVVSVSPLAGGAVTVDPVKPFYDNNETVTLTAAAATGWFFTGWSGDLTGISNPATLLMNGDKNVTAHFSQDTVTLAVQVNGSGDVVVTPQKVSYNLGETVTLLAVPDRGSLFDGWGGDATGSANPLTVVMNSSKTVTAIFTAVQYTVVVDMVGQGAVEINPAKATYSHNETITLTANPAPGWRFLAWSRHLTGSEPIVQTPVRRNLRITATFAEEGAEMLALATAVVGAGQVQAAPAQATYAPGQVVTLTAQPAAGWLFVGWSGDLSGDDNPAALVMDANKAVNANFGATVAGFVTNSISGGQVKVMPELDADKPFYAVGDEVALEAIPDAGWVFEQWEVSGVAVAADVQTSQNPLEITIDGQTRYTPKFVPTQVGGGDGTLIYLPVVAR